MLKKLSGVIIRRRIIFSKNKLPVQLRLSVKLNTVIFTSNNFLDHKIQSLVIILPM